MPEAVAASLTVSVYTMKGFFKGCEGLWSAARIPGGACSKDLTLPRLGDEIPC